MEKTLDYNEGYTSGYECGYDGGNLIDLYKDETDAWKAGYQDGNRDGHDDRPRRNW